MESTLNIIIITKKDDLLLILNVVNRDFYSDSMLSKYIHIKLLQAQMNGDLEQCSCLTSLLHALHY